MKVLNAREKNLGILTLVVVSVFAVTSLSGHYDKRRAELASEAQGVEDRVRAAEALLTETPAPVVAAKPRDRALTLNLLTELTLPTESEKIRVVRVERTAETAVRMVVEGRFAEMMKFMSYLEREGSHFGIASAELEKLKQGADPAARVSVQSLGEGTITESYRPPSREVRAVLSLTTKS